MFGLKKYEFWDGVDLISVGLVKWNKEDIEAVEYVGFSYIEKDVGVLEWLIIKCRKVGK